MKDKREEEILTQAAAEYIAREAGRSTLITPTRTELSSNRKHATIFISVFPSEQSEHAIEFLKRHRDLFRDFMKKKVRLAVLPFIAFEIDYGERNRQRMDELSNEAGISPEE